MSLESRNELRENLRVLVRQLGLLDKAEAECCGASLAQCHALVEIGRAGALSLNDLAELLMLDKSTMSRTLNNLVESGLAVREPNLSDRRYVEIRLTPRGAAQYRAIDETAWNYYQQVLDKIPPEKQSVINESLAILTQAIHDAEEPVVCRCEGEA